ncbi:DEAD/DEAH box helicase [Idiomarina xiamenensis]|uniref:Helicase, ATP-dependent n=1 Tax=Idiomarina xiamenensis 10-D-4 TaxID=740709 RepID=K2KY10_9GAMM|nr:DEAD/DEAH box helicase [Idiomarina xiamenensis]EKE87459.1 helicase, ATP-dependent [Idiomarina xiamenensis 10-D-4]
MNNQQLPVNDVIAELIPALAQTAVILQAPPGAGKSTALPLALLAAQSAHEGRIIMLQPRRVAAIGIAHYLAQQLGEKVGQQVGYQVRGDRALSSQTRLLIVTEGTFTRMIQADPLLDDVSLVIFDEFHERQLHSDLGLALVLESRQVKPQLQLLIMSATLPAADIAAWLDQQGQATRVFVSQGREYPIQLHYRPPPTARDWQQQLPAVVAEAWQQAQHSVLVFLPGNAEIARLAEALRSRLAGVPLQPLHGGLSLAQQQAVLNPQQSQRRIVLATNIAETSLTLSDIDTVVDCGRERVALFHPQQGISRLLTQRISRAAAEQRAGRAGRLRAGACYRLWSAQEQARLREYAAADIDTQELTGLLLECRAWGSEPSQMAWLTPPNDANLAVAEQLLQQLGICNQRGQLTVLGQQLPAAASDPRLAVIAYHCAQPRQADATLAATAVRRWTRYSKVVICPSTG